MTTKLLGNQLRSILNEPVEGFTVELADESDMFEWRVWIEGPRDTAYQGGIFQLSLKFPKDYPMSPPELKFVSDFWHPNVFPNGKVCMSILHPPGEDVMSGELPEERWLPTQSVTTIILSLQSVLNDPNCASPANVDASVEWRNSREAFKTRCRKLVEKAVRECPAHVVIPHPESDADQHKRRVQKFHEMNKDLDYEDFYENDAAEEPEEENESGDENEFLESENEGINTDDVSSPAGPHPAFKSSEEQFMEACGASEAASKKEEEDKHTEEHEVKPQSKGKEKAPEDSSSEEELAAHSSSSSSSATPSQAQPPYQPSSTNATLTDSNVSSSSTNDSSLASSSSNNNNSNDASPPAGKKGKRGKKPKKCVIM